MKNIHFTRTVITDKQEIDSFNCKSKTVLEVNSTSYNEDLNYQKGIDEKLRAYQLKNI